MTSVNGRRRVALPPAKITPFIVINSNFLSSPLFKDSHIVSGSILEIRVTV